MSIDECRCTDDGRRARPAVGQHHPHALDRCGRARQVGAPRHTDGAGATRLHDLEPRDALRSGGPDLAQPRSVRALQRSRLDAALVGAASDRHAGGECRLRAVGAAFGVAGGHPPLPPDRQQGARAPRVSLGVGGGNHDGAARAGRRDERGHGHRPEVARRPLQPTGLRDLRLRHLRRVRRRLPDGGRRRPKRPRSPVTSVSTTCAGSTTTTTSRSKGRRASPSRRTSPPGSSRTGGTSCAWATPTTSIASSTRSASSARRRGVRRSSSSTATSATAPRTSTTPPRPTASRSVKRKSASPSAATAGRRTRSSWSPTACASTSPPASARAAPRREAGGPRSSRHTEPSIPTSRARSIRCSDEICRPGGIATSRSSRRMPRASPAATPRARCSTCSRRASRGSSAGRRISGRRTRPR